MVSTPPATPEALVTGGRCEARQHIGTWGVVPDWQAGAAAEPRHAAKAAARPRPGVDGNRNGDRGWTVVEIPSTAPGRHHKHVHPSGRPPPRLAGAPPPSGRPSLPSPSSSASRSLTLSHLAAAAATPLRRDRLLGAAGRHGARRVTSAPRAHPPGVLASRRKGR